MDHYAHLRNSLSYMCPVFIQVQCMKKLKISISRKGLSLFPKKINPNDSGSGEEDFLKLFP